MPPLGLVLRLRSARELSACALLIALYAITACGSSERRSIELAPPLESAIVSSYTGWFGGSWTQEIRIQLAEGVELSDVADLRAFGPLRPGMSLDTARDLLGEPVGVSTDYHRGTEWNHWSNQHGIVEVGCVETCSGEDCSTSWRLRAVPAEREVESIFHPAIAAIVRDAEDRRSEVETRSVGVDTSDYEEGLTLILESDWGEHLWWAPWGAECDMPAE